MHVASEGLRRSALTVATAAVALRLLCFAIAEPWTDEYLQTFLQLDSLGYHELAVSMLDGEFKRAGVTDAFRTPLYPGFLAFFYLLGGNNPWVPLLGQIALDGGTCYLLCVLFKHQFAAYLYAFHPVTVFQANVVMSETVLVFVLALGLAALLRRNFLMAGVAFGLAALTKPAALYLFPVLLIWITFVFRRERIRAAAFLGLSFVVTISPWLMRNYITFDELSLSSSGRYNILDLHASRVVANAKSIGTKQAVEELHAEARKMATDAGANISNPFVLGEYQKKLALDIFKENPGMVVRTYIVGMLRMFVNLNTQGVARMYGIRSDQYVIMQHENPIEYIRRFAENRSQAHFVIGGVTAVYLLLFYGMVAVGCLAWLRNRDVDGWLCLLVALYFMILPGPGGVARYLMPAMVFFLYFVPFGFPNWLRAKSLKSSPS
jgi:4-amino-4-deoxy-L-arabinose transferase-like glycosyltransferase